MTLLTKVYKESASTDRGYTGLEFKRTPPWPKWVYHCLPGKPPGLRSKYAKLRNKMHNITRPMPIPSFWVLAVVHVITAKEPNSHRLDVSHCLIIHAPVPLVVLWTTVFPKKRDEKAEPSRATIQNESNKRAEESMK
jgi:hypothetical protein